MIGVAMLCAALATWLAVGRDGSLRRERLLAGPAPPRRARRLGWLKVAAPVAAGVIAAGLLGGRRAAVVAIVVAMAGATATAVVRGRWRQRRAIRRRIAVAGACSALASEVAIGKVALEALADAARDWPVLAEAAATAGLGGSPTAVWRVAAQQPGAGGLSELAQAWDLATRTGAPMAPTLDAVAGALREDRSIAQTIDGELAAPRATGRLIAFLPVVGVGIGIALGGDPLSFLISNPIGQVCLVVGVGLACAGLLWSERIADRAASW